MKLWIKILIGACFVIGTGGCGYMIWDAIRQRKQDKEFEKSMTVEYFFDKDSADHDIQQAAKEQKESIMRDPDDPKHEATDINPAKFARGIDGYLKDRKDLENFEQYLAGLESPEDDDEDEEYDDDIHRGAGEPYTITPGEFCNTRSYYDKVSLNYFNEDDVVSDDRDEIMENAPHILGNLQAAFAREDAPDTIYIRNEELEVDYEVSLVRSSYRKEVLHLNEE